MLRCIVYSSAMQQKQPIYDEPGECRAVAGTVRLEGPDDVHVAMTPEAAEETSERLLAASFEARGQTRLNDMPHRPKD